MRGLAPAERNLSDIGKHGSGEKSERLAMISPPTIVYASGRLSF